MERVSLSNAEFEGKNNVYLLEGGGRTALVDTGYDTPAIRSELEDGLADYGLGFEDVTDIFLTHWHHDHVGMAGTIQQASDATVYAHPADAGLLSQEETSWAEYESIARTRFEEWGMPSDKRAELLEILDLSGRQLGQKLTDVQTFDDGAQFTIGSTSLEAVHLPGHTMGLCGFAIDAPDGSEHFLSSDALLPEYTPNVGGGDVRMSHPLQAYLDSLHHIVDREFSKAWPGHRTPIDDPAARAAEIISHHNTRTERVFDAVREHGPIDTWSISAALFGSLSAVHIIHGPGEVSAHINHLLAHNLVEETPDGYVCDDPDAAVESALSSVCG